MPPLLGDNLGVMLIEKHTHEFVELTKNLQVGINWMIAMVHINE